MHGFSPFQIIIDKDKSLIKRPSSNIMYPQSSTSARMMKVLSMWINQKWAVSDENQESIEELQISFRSGGFEN
jgi:hypothetical protein